MQILFDDIIFSLQRAGGISTYWRNLTERIRAMPDCSVTRVPKPPDDMRVRRDDPDNGPGGLQEKIGYVPKPKVYLWRYLPVLQPGGGRMVFHSSYYRSTRNRNAVQVTTVHDFVYERYMKGLARSVHSAQKRAAVLRSDGIICVSESTARDLRVFFPKTESRIAVIHNGVSPAFRFLDISDVGEQKPSILFIGKRGGYKNFGALLDAFHELKHDYALTLVGGGAVLMNESDTINRCVGPDNWRHIEHATEEELNETYNRSFCLVYPSKYEGFGIPVVEAMRAGCPVICGTNSSLKEAGGDAACYISSETGEAIADAVRSLESANLPAVREAGFRHASRFSWDSCAKKTYEFYRELWSK